jgi:hypothetical protein
MDDRKQKYVNILNEKLDALLQMLEATKRFKITGEGEEEVLEQEAERFASLYEQRAVIFTRIEKMDEELAQLKAEGLGLPDKKFDKSCKDIEDKTREAAKALAELDKKNIEASEKLTAFLRGNLKKIRDGRDMSHAYVDTHHTTSGYYFDRTN